MAPRTAICEFRSTSFLIEEINTLLPLASWWSNSLMRVTHPNKEEQVSWSSSSWFLPGSSTHHHRPTDYASWSPEQTYMRWCTHVRWFEEAILDSACISFPIPLWKPHLWAALSISNNFMIRTRSLGITIGIGMVSICPTMKNWRRKLLLAMQETPRWK